jgi:hypothetical protein
MNGEWNMSEEELGQSETPARRKWGRYREGLNIRIDDATLEELRAYADTLGASVSDAARALITKGLRRRGRGKKRSDQEGV